MARSDAQAHARLFLEALLGDASSDAAARLVDWPRFRLMQLIPGTAGSDPELREQLIARGLVELARGRFGAAEEERAVRSLRSLVELLLPRGWRFVDDYVNPMLVGLASGPTPSTPPNLKRYLTMLQELAQNAEAVTIAGRDDVEGQKLMTLLFVDGRYVGFLPGSQN
jgi:hypothetical protein